VSSAAPAGQLRAEDVSFAYVGAARAALRHVNLSVAPGEVVLITGASGCGKSTQALAATGLDAFIGTFVLSCDLGIAKPAPEPFLTACERLGVSPERTLMVGNNRVADSGSICVGCHCLILPPVPPGATRGLRAAADMAGLPWPG